MKRVLCVKKPTKGNFIVGKIYDCSMDAKQMFCYEVRDENGKIYEFDNDESSFEKSEDSHEEKERLVTGDVVIDINKGENVTINDVYILFFYLNKKGKKIEFCYNMPIVKKETEYQVQRLESVKVTPDFIDRGSGYMPSSYMVVRPVLGRDRGEYKILDRKISLFELYEKICDGAIEFTII